MDKLRQYFDRSTPEKLQEVYFNIEYYLGTRGREWIRHLRKNQIYICFDSNGRKYVDFPNLHTIQKNEQPSISNTTGKSVMKQSRIYAHSTASTCPVEAIKVLLSKLPDCCQSIFYRKRKDWEDSDTWYNAKLPMGMNTIGDLMKSISKSAKLSKTYTCHCIRSTVITSMSNVGASVIDIQCVSGHKSGNSVNR